MVKINRTLVLSSDNSIFCTGFTYGFRILVLPLAPLIAFSPIFYTQCEYRTIHWFAPTGSCGILKLILKSMQATEESGTMQ